MNITNYIYQFLGGGSRQEEMSPAGQALYAFGVGIIAALGALWPYRNAAQPAAALEEEFKAVALDAADIRRRIDFGNFLTPNEGNPEQIDAHFRDLDEPFILVGTGTERNFFHLAALTNPHCQGAIIVDLNPKVKAYVDFNTLLLRISADRLDYLRLSSFPQSYAEGSQRLEEIRSTIDQSKMSLDLKRYYHSTLEDYSSIYFSVDKLWRTADEGFQAVRYTENDAQFKILQKFAKSGKILVKTGDIHDLRFLGNRSIVVDLSNIPDYCITNFDVGDGGPSILKAIWTNIGGCPLPGPGVRGHGTSSATYFSTRDISIPTQEKREELQELVQIFRESRSFHISPSIGLGLNLSLKLRPDQLLQNDPATLAHLRERKNSWLMRLPEIGWVDFAAGPDFINVEEKTLGRLDLLSLSECEQLHRTLPARFRKTVVKAWEHIGPAHYAKIVLSGDPEWKRLFEQERRSIPRQYLKELSTLR